MKSKRIKASKAISWSWDTILGRAKSKVAFVPYSQNSERQSRWAAFDFDAHDGNCDRARALAFESFRRLMDIQGISIILEGTGSGGWHGYCNLYTRKTAC